MWAALGFLYSLVLFLAWHIDRLRDELRLERETRELLALQVHLRLEQVGQCLQVAADTMSAYTEFLRTLGADNAEARHHLETWLEEHR